METKLGNCACSKKNILLRRVGNSFLCVDCAMRSEKLSEDSKKQILEDTDGGKETLMD